MAEKSGKQLPGPQKAAILLLSMGEEFTAEVFKRLKEDEIKELARQMTKIEPVSGDIVDNLTAEFRSFVSWERKESTRGLTVDGDEFFKKAVNQAFKGEQGQAILAEIEQEWKLNFFQTIKNLDNKMVGNFIKSEHPQTIALILAHLEQSQAAGIIRELPQNIQADILMRIAMLEKVSPEVIAEIDKAIQEELTGIGGTERARAIGGIQTAAEILNQIDRATEAAIMEQIEEQEQDLADEIRKMMFIFEDLLQVDDRGIMAMLKEISSDELKLALKTASEELKEKILRNMSSRAAEMLKEDMEVAGPARLRDVELAQQAIIKVAKRLENEGKIMLGDKGGEDVFV
ncbi:MAG: flagellar motor switch protein FliG [Deltaproteobacteria bacterium]|nr:flagellar motor switch protein FliG [Deltaproteobacteria bacterium]